MGRSTLSERSPRNWFSGKEVFMAYRMYFDGSGASHDKNQRFLTLGCCAAEEAAWAEFERRWAEVLHKPPTAPYMHMIEALHRPDPEGAFRGWEKGAAIGVIDRILESLVGQWEIKAYTFSVELAVSRDWADCQEWRAITGGKSPERLCAEWCFYRPIEVYCESGPLIVSGIETFFDRNEPFLRQVHSDWENKSNKRRFPQLALVSCMTPVEMQQYPPVQLADMLAWSEHGILTGNLDAERAEVAQRTLDSVNRKRVVVDDTQVLKKLGLYPVAS